jgi:DNA-binding transcriptional MocR family regulator
MTIETATGPEGRAAAEMSRAETIALFGPLASVEGGEEAILDHIRGIAKPAERAYLGIRHAILTGLLKGGDHLREETLAQMTGTSRTPVREALRRLVAEGLATADNRHRFVTDFSYDEVVIIFDGRAWKAMRRASRQGASRSRRSTRFPGWSRGSTRSVPNAATRRPIASSSSTPSSTPRSRKRRAPSSFCR